jgi:hypothetical protein
MYVYLVGNADLSWYKIGVSRKDVTVRLEQIQASVPFTLQLLGHWRTDWAFDIEKMTHEKFWKHHLRGEWFKDLDIFEVAKFISEKVRTFNG